jgi:hypothetical protein
MIKIILLASLIVMALVVIQQAKAQSDNISQWEKDLVGDTFGLVVNLPQGCDKLKQTDKDLLPQQHAMIIKIECRGLGGVNYLPQGCVQVGKEVSQEHHSMIYSIKCTSTN